MANITKDLGVVTAYGYHKAGGGTLTEEQFEQKMVDITTAVDDAEASASDAEAYGAGTRGGTAVPSTDGAYQNNAKYYKEQAQQTAQSLSQSVQQIATNTSDITDLKEDLSEISGIEDIEINTNGFYRLTGTTITPTPESNANYKCTMLTCTQGEIFTVSGNSSGNAARLYVVTDASYNALIYSMKDATLSNYIFAIPADGAYLFVNDYRNGVTLKRGKSIVQKVDENTQKIESMQNDFYATVPLPNTGVDFANGGLKGNDGTRINTVTNRLYTVDYIPEYVKEMHINETGYSINLFAYSKADDTYIGLWDTATQTFKTTAWVSTDIKDINLVDCGNYHFKIQIRGPYADSETMPLSDASNVLAYAVVIYLPEEVNPENYKGSELSVFDKMLCIGDSIIAGGANHPAGLTPDQENASREVPVSMYSIPTFLSKMYGIQTTNWGISGATSRSWYNAKSAEDWSGYDCALIRIGNNDYTYATSDGLTPAECATLSKHYVELIIAKLKADNAGIRIFLCTLNKSNSIDRLAEYRVPMMEAFRQIAAADDSVFLVDTNIHSNYNTSGGYYNGHPTAIGYQMMAQDIGSIISYIIANNDADFKWIRWIGTEYAVVDGDDIGPDDPDVG